MYGYMKDSMETFIRQYFTEDEIYYFDFHRFYFNGDEINLCNHPEFNDLYLKEHLYPNHDQLSALGKKSIVFLSDKTPLPEELKGMNLIQNTLQSMQFNLFHRDYFGIRSIDHYDVFGLAINGNNDSNISKLLSLQGEIENISNEFYLKFEQLIEKKSSSLKRKLLFFTNPSIDINSPFKNILSLSPREQEIAKMKFSRRMKTREIASLLFISPRTVEKHIENIKVKLGLISIKDIDHNIIRFLNII